MPALQIPPHPTLPEYYEANESRQRFLNDLFDRTAYRYRRSTGPSDSGSGPWYRRRALRDAGLRAGM